MDNITLDRKSRDYDVSQLTKSQILTTLYKLRPMVYLQNELIWVGF